MVTGAGGRAAPAFVDCRRDVDARRLQRGGEAEDEPGHDRDRDREDERGRVDRDRAGAWRVRPGERGQQRHRPDREQQSNQAAADGKDDALDQQLRGNPGAARADRGANRDLLLPADRARQQQVGHVGARDQQDEADRGDEHEQRLPHVLHREVVQGLRFGADAVVALGVLRRQPVGDHVELRLGGRQIDAVLEPCDRKDAGMPRTILRGSVAAQGPIGNRTSAV